MKKLEDRPPYVEFEVRTLEDRNATIEKGEFVAFLSSSVLTSNSTWWGSLVRIQSHVS